MNVHGLESFGSLEDCFQSLEESRRELLDLLDGIDENVLVDVPAGETWSIVMIAEHIARAERSAAKVIRYIRRYPDAESMPKRGGGHGRWRHDGRAIAPEETEPDGTRAPSQIRAELEEARRLLHEVIRQGEYPFDRGITFRHPFFGDLTALGWVRMAACHERHHLTQMQTRRASTISSYTTMSEQRDASATRRKRVFSGIQPTGAIHLGNYLGAIRQWVVRQEERENFFCIVDLHSLTVYQEPEALRRQTRSLAAIYLAAGLRPEISCLFVQSHVTAHAEGCWLLNCITPLGWLNKMTQFKDKAMKQESVLAGLLDYPVLMAADILLYDADEVPVGHDQKQHVELARNIAERFNRLYGDTFVVPTPMIPPAGARVMGLDDPTAKMSKSSASKDGHAVSLLDDPETIMKSFKRAVTDSYGEIRFSGDPDRAGVDNLLGIYSAVTGKGKEAVMHDFADARGYGDLKARVAEVVIESLRPIREGHDRYMADAAELDAILERGAARAREVAMPKLRLVKERMGLVV